MSDTAAESLFIRDMQAPDLPRVLAIEAESYSVPWSEETFVGLLRRRDADTVVLLDGEEIAGYSVSWCVLDQGELGNVAVSAAWRGRGLGGRLVAEMLLRARRRGVAEMFLEVRPTNVAARRLYESFGFRQVGARRNYYQEPTEDALVLRRVLAAGD